MRAQSLIAGVVLRREGRGKCGVGVDVSGAVERNALCRQGTVERRLFNSNSGIEWIGTVSSLLCVCMCVCVCERQTDRQKWQLCIIYKTKERGLEGEDGIYVFFFFFLSFLRVVIVMLELLFSFT